MGAYFLELKADDRGRVSGRGDGEAEVLGEEVGIVEAFGRGDVAVDADEFAAGIADDVFFPGDARTAVGAEEVVFVGWEVAETEFVVVHCEMAGGEVFVVGFAFPLDVACAPAAVNQFPFAVVDSDGVPSVGGVFGRDGCAWSQGRKAVAFPVAANDNAFKACFTCYGGEEARVALTDRQAGGESRGGSRRFYSVIEKGFHVVRNVMMEPCKNCTGFVGKGREWTR